MKKIILFALLISALTASAAEKKNSKNQGNVKTAAKTAVPAVPAKPVVPEKKQPYELWMTAHEQALEAARQKKYDEALQLFDKAIEEANKGMWKNYSLYEKVRLLGEMKKYDEALALLDEPLRKDRNTPYHRARVMLMRGELLMQCGKYDDAAAEWTRAAQSGENNWISADAVINLGKLCALRKDFDGAVKHFRSILNDTSRLPGIRGKALLAEAEMLKKEKKFAEGIALIDAQGQIEQLPADKQLELAFARSEFQIALKDLKGARETLEKALTIQGKSAPYQAALFSRIAEVLFLQKRYREAQNMMQRARSVRGHEWGYNKGFHNEINMAVAKENSERAVRERQLRERQRKERLERERKARLEKERKARLERQRKAQKKTGTQK